MIAMALDLPPRRPTQAHSSSTRFSDALVRPVYLVEGEQFVVLQGLAIGCQQQGERKPNAT
jgi:hypothetical protein